MWRSSLLVEYLWLSSPLVQLVLVAVMVRSRLHREFPMFFTYSFFRALTSLLAFSLFRAHVFGEIYGYINWTREVGCIILRFAVIYELFGVLLKAYSALRNIADSLFRWGTVGLLAIAVSFAVHRQWHPYDSRLGAGLDLIDTTVDFVQCGLLIALLVFFRYLRLSSRNYGFGIVVGLGIFATVDLATSAVLLMESGKVPFEQQGILQLNMTVISMAGYLVSVLIWLGYSLFPQPAPELTVRISQHDLDSWNEEMQRFLQP